MLTNLLELYVHDFSEHVAVPLKPNGRFDVSLDERWWTADDHFPFLVLHRHELAGFALVRRGSRVTTDTELMDVAEFFVVRGARRRGVGLAAAHALFARFPGRWELRIRRSNAAAKSFWLRAAAALLGHDAELSSFSSQGVDWDVVRLDSSRAHAR
ncbi:MAG TPA: GNAT family N-acetyltransferase [Polyangiaceae bacterium]|nr:GNAT family N-acetyltransferase [Polyangiaceae bacterium]